MSVFTIHKINVTDYRISGREAHYIEGYLLVNGFALTPHAWVELVDPTPVHGQPRVRYVDPTMPTIESHHSFVGIKIPASVLVACCCDDGWTKSTGCLETMRFFSDSQLAWVGERFEEARNA